MLYDIFVIHSMCEANFVLDLAKSLQRYNVSVRYSFLPCQQDVLKNAIKKGFEEASFGVVILSKNFFIQYQDGLFELSNFLSTETQLLHPIWLKLRREEINHWKHKLLGAQEERGFESPPETIESIARQLHLKLSGSITLQRNVFEGEQIQYVAPRIETFRGTNDSESFVATKQSYLASVQANTVKNIVMQNEIINSESALMENPDEESIFCKDGSERDLISERFSSNIRFAVSKRLDIYLKKVSNWKDLAKCFNIDDPNYFRYLYKTKTPTLVLLGDLSSRNVTVNEFLNACRQIRRYDVIDEIERVFYNEKRIESNWKYTKD